MKDARTCMSHSRLLVFLVIPMLAMGKNITRLKILVPVRNFNEFVTIKTDPLTKETTFGGFAIDVFKTVMNEAVATPILFDFIAYAKPDGTMNGTFDDMLKAVSPTTYHGAAGEISILYSRTQSVDFTMPYLDTSISMLVPLRQQANGNRGISMGTVTKYVVASSLALSFIVALLFWFLEYRNDRQPIMATSSRDDDHENWLREMSSSLTQTRLVMILFFMVLLVLVACYTAYQTSSLAVQRPSGGLKNLNQLIRSEANVGYRQGSYIRDRLKLIGFQDSNLISLNSSTEMVEMLSKGTAQGGVDAVVADTPNLKILVAKHCGAFTIVPAVNLHAAGFGFAFYKGYPQLNAVSDGILRITDDGRLAKIQDRTIGSLEACQDNPNATSDSALLDSGSLWILIAGAVAVFLLMIMILLVYCGMRSNTNKTKKVIAFPCYLSPCC